MSRLVGKEAQGASSRKDFSNKIKIVYREVRESHYWSRILSRMGWGNKEKVKYLVNECSELKKIFGRIRQILKN
ncbi:MAG: four helix bundle protein [Candidatus Marinimicrobia bacterium]|nr:four helix bundle protein [Candidatus Neomarinimicrobiota bacterium]